MELSSLAEGIHFKTHLKHHKTLNLIFKKSYGWISLRNQTG